MMLKTKPDHEHIHILTFVILKFDFGPICEKRPGYV